MTKKITGFRVARRLTVVLLPLLLLMMIGVFRPHIVDATPWPVVHLSGTMTADETLSTGTVYMIDSTYTVPTGKTLTINAGSVVKFENNTGTGGRPIQVEKGGVLNVNGISSSPVTFTSYRDDSFGGDSNGDGTSTGSYGDYGGAINNQSGQLTIAYLNIKYAISDVYDDCSNTPSANSSISDSIFTGTVTVYECTDSSWVSMQRNQFGVQQSIYYSDPTALDVIASDPTSISLSGINKNTFAGTGVSRRMSLASTTIPSGSTWTIDAASNVVIVRKGSPSLDIKGTLNLSSGLIVKSDGSYSTASLHVYVGGVLNVDGTSSAPVIFTSYKDDSVGGDTNGDGASSSATGGDSFTAIDSSGGTVNIDYATSRYNARFLYGYCQDDYTHHVNNSITINDSDIPNVVWFDAGCTADQINMQRNTLGSDTSDPALVVGRVDPSNIILSGTDKNIFTGTGRSRQLAASSATIASGSTWDIDGSSNAVLTIGSSGPTFDIGGVLNLTGGVIVKNLGNDAYGVNILDDGELNIIGTLSDPVVLTSINDDSYGGDTAGDGSTTATNASYGAAIFNSGGTVNLNHALIKYAVSGIYNSYGDLTTNNTAISNGNGSGSAHTDVGVEVNGGEVTATNTTIDDYSTGVSLSDGKAELTSFDIDNVTDGILVSGGDGVRFRGTMTYVSGKKIKACNWYVYDEGCAVDAAYNDWGDPDGPETSVCGAVVTSPYISSGVNHANVDNPFTGDDCDYGPRPSDQLAAEIAAYQSGTGPYEIDCGNGFHDACDQMHTSYACLSAAVDVESPFTIPDASDGVSVTLFASELGGNAANFVGSLVDPANGKTLAQFSSGLFQTVGLYFALSSAYDTCNPA